MATHRTPGADPQTHLGATAAKWNAIGLSTAAADREAATESVRVAYRSAGLDAPAHVVWLDSPAAGARAAALLTGRWQPPARSGSRHRGGPGDTGGSGGPVDVVAVLNAQGCPVTPGSAGGPVRRAVHTAPWAAAREELHTALGHDGWARLWSACGAEVWRTVTERVATPLRAHLRGELPDGARMVLLDAAGGQHDAGWLAAFDAASPLPLALDAAHRLAGLAGVARSAGWWWPYATVAVLTERPAEVHRDNIGRLHAAGGPALRYRDGSGLHAWRGMPIPSDLVDELSRLTHRRIAEEPNAELRRVMLEHYGYERYLREADARRVAEDECGVLWSLWFRNDEPLVMVEVVNSTPEPDGTSRTYWLRVPPQTRTAREGVAWTFGLTEQEYQPLVQT